MACCSCECERRGIRKMSDRILARTRERLPFNLGLATLTAACLALVFGACLLTVLDASRPRPAGVAVGETSLAVYQLRHPL